MNAWLLTWEWISTKPQEKIVAILSSRRSDASIAELMELLVLRATSTADSMAYYANRRKELVYKSQRPLLINGIPHGERIICGHDPWLYGRKVRNLKVVSDESTNEEIISWSEPDDFRWTDERRQNIEVAREGQRVVWRRSARPLSSDIWVAQNNAPHP